MSERRINVQVLGRSIGTASGWDDMGEASYHFYDFQPNDTLIVLDCGTECRDIGVDFEKGYLTEYDALANETRRHDLIEIVGKLPRG
jgi:hypothetical protein